MIITTTTIIITVFTVVITTLILLIPIPTIIIIFKYIIIIIFQSHFQLMLIFPQFKLYFNLLYLNFLSFLLVIINQDFIINYYHANYQLFSLELFIVIILRY